MFWEVVGESVSALLPHHGGVGSVRKPLQGLGQTHTCRQGGLGKKTRRVSLIRQEVCLRSAFWCFAVALC